MNSGDESPDCMCSPYGPMDKAPAYGAGDSGFESQYGLTSFSFFPWPRSARFLSPCSRRYAQTDQPIPESFVLSVELTKKVIEQKKGVMRESNSRPPAPKAGIIPLDQSPSALTTHEHQPITTTHHIALQHTTHARGFVDPSKGMSGSVPPERIEHATLSRLSSKL